jgi:putative endonuclease
LGSIQGGLVVTTVSVGRQAETLAAEHLTGAGLVVVDRNWRNRWCEIDIVARDRAGVIHIVEVKYRRSTAYGVAAEYISRDKAARLRRAALAWVQAHRHAGDYQVDLVTVEGHIEEPSIVHVPNVDLA